MIVNERSSLRVARAQPRDGRAAMTGGVCLFAVVLVLLSGCGPKHVIATARIPQPLVVKIPVTVALFMPAEFMQYVHKEERWGTDWNIDIGKAQTDALSGLLTAMFERVIVVDSLNAGSQVGETIAAILEPSVEEYAFETPRDAGSPFYAVSIKYRVNVYLPDGKLADSWGFTGYGTAPAGGLSNTEPLQNATALAMRDAGAKLAVEFRDQAIVRGLLPDAETADDPAAPASSDAPSTEDAPAGSSDDTSISLPAPIEPAPAEGEIETEPAPGEPQDDESEEPVVVPDPEALARIE